jgi:hypothetical protein
MSMTATATVTMRPMPVRAMTMTAMTMMAMTATFPPQRCGMSFLGQLRLVGSYQQTLNGGFVKLIQLLVGRGVISEVLKGRHLLERVEIVWIHVPIAPFQSNGL